MSTAIFFDLDGTLLTSEQSFTEIFETACERVEIEYDRAVHEYFTERFFTHFEDFRPNPFVTAGREAVHEFDLDADGKALGEARIDAEVEATRVPESVRETIADLAGRHPLGVLTDGIEAVQRRKLAAHDLDCFEVTIVSEGVGAMKPDAAIFEAARDAIPASEYVYVGDSIDRDLPAGEHGFRTMLVGDEDANEADLAIADHSAFSRIEELLSAR